MLDIEEIESLTGFQRGIKRHIEQLKVTGRPRVLTVKGRAALVVQDAAAYQRDLSAGRIHSPRRHSRRTAA